MADRLVTRRVVAVVVVDEEDDESFCGMFLFGREFLARYPHPTADFVDLLLPR